MLRNFLMFCLIASWSWSTAQEDVPPQNGLSLSIVPHYGVFIPHRKEIRNLVTGHAYGIQASLEWLMDGEKSWQREYQFPGIGIDFSWSNLGNSDQLGNISGISGFARLPLNSSGNFNHYLKIGAGIGYSSLKWDLTENYKNVTLGSDINANIFLQWGSFVKLSKSSNLHAGIRMLHQSNGSFKLPNLGVNLFSAFIGYEHILRPTLKSTSVYTPTPTKNWRHEPFIGIGLKEVASPNKSKYTVFVASWLSSYRITPKSSFGAQLDYFHDQSLQYLMEEHTGNGEPKDQNQVGLMASYQLHLNKIEILIQAGIYLYSNYLSNGSVYNRFGIRYRITDQFYTDFRLKTHQAKADHPELGIGYSF